MTPIRRAALAAATVVTLVPAVSGCLGTDDDAKASQPASKSGITVANSAKVLAKATFPSSMAPGATVDVALNELKVDGRLARLSVTMTPHARGATERPTPYRLNNGSGLGTSLIDTVNLKRYVVVKDSSGQSLQSDDVTTNLTNDQPGMLSYTFAAPPQDVDQVDVQLGSWPVFQHVPVAR